MFFKHNFRAQVQFQIPIRSGVPVVAVVLYIKHPEELSVCFAILYAELRTVQGIDSYRCRRTQVGA